MFISAQISVYPLRQEWLSPAIGAVKEALESRGLEPQIGAMKYYGDRGCRGCICRVAGGIRSRCVHGPRRHDRDRVKRLSDLDKWLISS